MLPVAREHDVVLGLENHYKDGFWKVSRVRSEAGCVPGTAARRFPIATISACSTTRPTPSSRATIPSRCCEAVADRVVSMHASDRYLAECTSLEELRQTDGTLGYSPNLRHGVTGKGLNDYDAIFRILAAHGYRGWVSIEDGMNGMEEMAESLAFLRRMSEKGLVAQASWIMRFFCPSSASEGHNLPVPAAHATLTPGEPPRSKPRSGAAHAGPRSPDPCPAANASPNALTVP